MKRGRLAATLVTLLMASSLVAVGVYLLKRFLDARVQAQALPPSLVALSLSRRVCVRRSRRRAAAAKRLQIIVERLDNQASTIQRG
jgi:hypothetical protein